MLMSANAAFCWRTKNTPRRRAGGSSGSDHLLHGDIASHSVLRVCFLFFCLSCVFCLHPCRALPLSLSSTLPLSPSLVCTVICFSFFFLPPPAISSNHDLHTLSQRSASLSHWRLVLFVFLISGGRGVCFTTVLPPRPLSLPLLLGPPSGPAELFAPNRTRPRTRPLCAAVPSPVLSRLPDRL